MGDQHDHQNEFTVVILKTMCSEYESMAWTKLLLQGFICEALFTAAAALVEVLIVYHLVECY